jgi:hypothetical protein
MSFSDSQDYRTANGSGEIAWVNNTVLQFSSSQFPTFEAQGMDSTTEWPPFQESDILLFNSLLDTDVSVNWDL